MIRFGILTDMQYADKENRNNRNYRASIDKFLEAIAVFAEKNVSFVLQLGDVVDSDWKNWTTIQELWKKTTKIPFRNVLGNHDLLVEDSFKPNVYSVLNLERPAYSSFVLRDSDDSENVWRFVVLDGNEISLYAAENDRERQEAEKVRERYRLAAGKLPEDWNGAVSDRQLDWLNEQLSDAEKNGQSVVICSHFPLFSQMKSHFDARNLPEIPLLKEIGLYLSDMGVSTWNGRQILDVLDRFSCVKAYFAGHLHEGGRGERNGVLHLTFRGMVEATPNAFSVVELSRDEIRVQGFGTEPTAVYSFR